MTYLYVAYSATWSIHIIYLMTVVRRYSRLQQEVEELNTKKS
jgi:CcmD family protein